MNEADNLGFILPLLPALVDEVVLVDGRSTDGTVEVARRSVPSVRVLEQIGEGKGNALAAGFRAATGDIIVMLDADGSADPGEIPRFLEALEQGAQFAKGTRFAAGGWESRHHALAQGRKRRLDPPGEPSLPDASTRICATGTMPS